MKRKGIILAGGAGTRLYPVTIAVSKQLMPVFDKPMIYYPLSVLMLAGIREIMVITTPEDQSQFQRLLGDGSHLGVDISWCVQPKPEGLAQAYLLAEEFLAGGPSAMILGDNIFYGHALTHMLSDADARASGATLFGYRVADPQRYGVVAFDDQGRATSIEEKPKNPKSNYAVSGLYFYDGRAAEMAKKITPSDRGELEITSLNQMYLEAGELKVELMGRGFAWFDTGTHDSLLGAASFVQMLQERQGVQIGSPEEIAFSKGFLTREQLLAAAERYKKNEYGRYLADLAGPD